MTINACLIGAGRMGRDHAKHVNFSPYGKLHSVVDPMIEGAQALANDYGAKAYACAEEALADPAVDAVLIVSPTPTHADLIMLAAKAGKPIFCEKPIDLDLERIDMALEVVKECNVPLLVGFNRRFDPSYQTFRSELQAGKVGSVELLSITSRDLALPSHDYLRSSGGLFRDMMIHDFDMARWLLGEEPTEVYATGSCLVDPSIAEFGDLDTSVVVLRTERGVICQLNCSRRAVYGYDQRLEVLGDKGMLEAKNLAETTVCYSGVEGIVGDKIHPSFPQRYREAYQIEIDHFFKDVASGKGQPLATGEDSRRAIVIAECAQESYEKGVPVAIPAHSTLALV